MQHFVKRLMLILVLLTLPALLYAGEKSAKKGNALADAIQVKLSGVSPLLIVIVDPSDNSVLLSGSVSSQEEADRITSMIRSIEDVRLVHSNLSISGAAPAPTAAGESETGSTAGSTTGSTTDTGSTAPTGEEAMDTPEGEPSETPGTTGSAGTISSDDASISAAVEERLKSEGIMGESKIQVQTENGVVTLTGTALSEAQMDRIVELARSVAGVQSVNSNLVLRDEKRQATPQPSSEVDKEGSDTEEEDDEEPPL